MSPTAFLKYDVKESKATYLSILKRFSKFPCQQSCSKSMWFDCHFQDIFSEIISHSGNMLLIMEDVLITVWGAHIIGKQILFPLQSCMHLHFLNISVMFPFWKRVSATVQQH